MLTAPRRYALLGLRQDGVIGLYFGLSGADVQARVDALRARAAPNVKTFLFDGTDHAVMGKPNLATSDGGTPNAWIQQAVDDAPGGITPAPEHPPRYHR
ncbi:MAG: hypothetical protein IRZ16_19620 [Myxococcaceae bacterium]|nr:hypothetical protein [Myxococcaceae bacterium]